MVKWRWLVTSLVVSQALVGCATLLGHDPDSQTISAVDWPLSDIRSVANTLLPVGTGSVSSNGRILRSRPFYPVKKEYKEAANAVDRYVAQFTLLGTGRPYDVEIVVYHERRAMVMGKVTYQVRGVDQRLTREFREKLETELSKRREDRNVVDDFRVY